MMSHSRAACVARRQAEPTYHGSSARRVVVAAHASLYYCQRKCCHGAAASAAREYYETSSIVAIEHIIAAAASAEKSATRRQGRRHIDAERGATQRRHESQIRPREERHMQAGHTSSCRLGATHRDMMVLYEVQKSSSRHHRPARPARTCRHRIAASATSGSREERRREVDSCHFLSFHFQRPPCRRCDTMPPSMTMPIATFLPGPRRNMANMSVRSR